jgi:diguanylate cyclase (GGDEF)-like protein
MLDVDDFKRINDSYGHAAGDSILRKLGGVLRRHVRGEDIACRYGGDEFIIVLPDTTLEVTRERSELVCKFARQFHLRHKGQTLFALTLSCGVAVLPQNGTTSPTILKAVDAALYRAKREGGDRAVVAY